MGTGNIYRNLARVEAVAAAVRAEYPEEMRRRYEAACEAENETEAAAAARAIRNRLLDGSDKEMSLDRLGLDASSPTKLIASLSAIFTGEWSSYRKRLRDLPQQEGFPFRIDWPEAPGGGSGSESEE